MADVDLGRWKGLVTDLDPHDIPPGAAAIQTNLTCIVAGRLRPRKGFQAFAFAGKRPWTSYATPMSMFRHRDPTGDSVVWQGEGSVWMAGANGSTTAIETNLTWAETEAQTVLNADGTPYVPLTLQQVATGRRYHSTFVQSRKGYLIRVNGKARGSIRIGTKTYPLGITPPATAPTVEAAAGGNSFPVTGGDPVVYYCAYRYRDDKGIVSSLSPITKITVSTPNQKFLWTKIPSSPETRVKKIELYRSTADNAIALYLVDTIDNGATIPTNQTLNFSQNSYAGETVLHLADPLTIGLTSGAKIMLTGLVKWASTINAEVTLTADAGSGSTTLTISPLAGTLIGGVHGTTATITNATGSLATDTYHDDTLVERQALPILYDDGSLCARRHDPPPTDLAVVVPFQDRLFFAVTIPVKTPIQASSGIVPVPIPAVTVEPPATAERRNLLVYSEPDEPESVPEKQNAIIVSDDQVDGDEITALFVHGSALFIGKSRHIYRMNYGTDPRFDGAVRLACSRGVFNQRCFAFHQDTVYLMDQYGAWRFQDESPEPISMPVQDYWRDGTIDFTKSDRFFVSVDPNESVARFFVFLTTDTKNTYPVRALCFSIAQNAWWWEEYPFEVGSTCRMEYKGRIRSIVGAEHGQILLTGEGIKDMIWANSASWIEHPITYHYRTGYIPLPNTADDPPKRRIKGDQIVLVYDPTATDESLYIRGYWDHEASPLEWFADGDCGAASVVRGDKTQVQVQLKSGFSVRGHAIGRERWRFNQRTDPQILTHHWIAIDVTGTVRETQHEICSLAIEGVD